MNTHRNPIRNLIRASASVLLAVATAFAASAPASATSRPDLKPIPAPGQSVYGEAIHCPDYFGNAGVTFEVLWAVRSDRRAVRPLWFRANDLMLNGTWAMGITMVYGHGKGFVPYGDGIGTRFEYPATDWAPGGNSKSVKHLAPALLPVMATWRSIAEMPRTRWSYIAYNTGDVKGTPGSAVKRTCYTSGKFERLK